MKAMRIWLIVMALLGLFVLNEYHSQRELISSLQGEIAKLRTQQDRLATDAARAALVGRTPVAARAVPSTDPPTAAPSAAPALADGRTGDAATRDQRWEEEARASRASVEEAFAAEPANPAWAASTRLALLDRLGSASRASGSSLGNVDCRASICRVEVVHRDADASRRFSQTAFTDPHDQAWNGPVVIMPPQANPDGSLAMVMYLGREGTSLLK
jgi:hypothetical protein